MKAAEGTALELFDCAFPLLAGIDIYDDAKRPSTARTSRCSSAPARARRAWSAPTCSRPTAAIFKPQGEALNAGAADDVRVLVVGNPANTNALIAHEQRAGHPARALHAMTRLDQNRAVAQLAQKTRRRASTTSRNLSIWGNHSPTMFPDLFNAKVNGQSRRRPGRP